MAVVLPGAGLRSTTLCPTFPALDDVPGGAAGAAAGESEGRATGTVPAQAVGLRLPGRGGLQRAVGGLQGAMLASPHPGGVHGGDDWVRAEGSHGGVRRELSLEWLGHPLALG